MSVYHEITSRADHIIVAALGNGEVPAERGLGKDPVAGEVRADT